ncbi:MAG: DUF2939 domain-containing protein [Proteobacteria bacterium]|nr:DUF2939 domain-containing protein [Pseudomonadota bacterium]
MGKCITSKIYAKQSHANAKPEANKKELKIKKIINTSAIILALMITYITAGPYLAFSEIKSGIANQDPVKISEYVDFPVLRQNFKEQINAIMMQNAVKSSDNPFVLLAAGIATAMTDKITDSLITPSGLASVLQGKFMEKDSADVALHSADKNKLFSNAKLGFDSLDTFSVRVKNQDDDEFRIVLQREGMQWKMVNIIFPNLSTLKYQE